MVIDYSLSTQTLTLVSRGKLFSDSMWIILERILGDARTSPHKLYLLHTLQSKKIELIRALILAVLTFQLLGLLGILIILGL